MNLKIKYFGMNFLSICILLLLFASCRPKEIDIDVQPAETKLVVASQIIPHQTMFIALTRSFSALASTTENDVVKPDFLEDVLVKNALVTVSYLGKTDTLSMLAPGVYGSAATLQYEYGTYTLSASDGKGLHIMAVSTLLPKVNFDTIYPVVDRTATDTTVSVFYQFADLKSISNWYVVNYYSKITADTVQANLDISYFFGRGNNQLVEFDLLSDRSFTDGQYTVTRMLDNVQPDDTIAVTLSNISEGYFRFLSAYKKSNNLFNQITGEPINYPTNVSDGYGYFNTHYPDVRIFDLKEFN